MGEVWGVLLEVVLVTATDAQQGAATSKMTRKRQ